MEVSLRCWYFLQMIELKWKIQNEMSAWFCPWMSQWACGTEPGGPMMAGPAAQSCVQAAAVWHTLTQGQATYKPRPSHQPRTVPWHLKVKGWEISLARLNAGWPTHSAIMGFTSNQKRKYWTAFISAEYFWLKNQICNKVLNLDLD